MENMSRLLDSERCPLCFNQIRFVVTTSPSPPADIGIECARCGRYDVGASLVAMPDIPDNLRPYLSAATRQAQQAGRVLLLHRKNLEQVAEPHRAVSISEKVAKVLRSVGSKCDRPGRVVPISPSEDYPLADCIDGSEFTQYVNYLLEKHLLQDYADDLGDKINGYAPTIEGWQTIEPTLNPREDPSRCFVAMSFDESLSDAYSLGIKPAIEKDCQLRCICLRDEVPQPTGITDRILSEIRLAGFVVADVTGQNHGVYFEAGFARGLGRDVIWTCHENEVGNLHFDTKHLGHVLWRDPGDLRRKLADSIRANVIRPRA